MKLGKNPATFSPHDIKLRAVMPKLAVLPAPPPRFGHGGAFHDWGMLANDRLGDCVAADMCHATMLWTKLGDPATATFVDSDTEKVYTQVAGYDPADPSTDQGTDMRQAMSVWRKDGIRDHNGVVHKIGAYVSVNPKDVAEMLQAAYVFGWVHIGFEFPSYAFNQFDAGKPWDVQDGGSIEGGHCVGMTGRSSSNDLGAITWGRRQGMTPRFYEKYNDEAWVTVSTDELRNGRNERGFDLTALNAALQQLGIGV